MFFSLSRAYSNKTSALGGACDVVLGRFFDPNHNIESAGLGNDQELGVCSVIVDYIGWNRNSPPEVGLPESEKRGHDPTVSARPPTAGREGEAGVVRHIIIISPTSHARDDDLLTWVFRANERAAGLDALFGCVYVYSTVYVLVSDLDGGLSKQGKAHE